MKSEKDLHSYQRITTDFIVNNTHFGLFLDMGMGKTVAVLTAVERLIYAQIEVNRVIVIGPKRVAELVWSMEVAEWTHTTKLVVSVVSGTEKQRLDALKKPADIYTISRDNTAWLCGLYGGSMLPFDMAVIDESSSFKNPKSMRFKALKMVQPSLERVVILTATPASKSLLDLWAQVYLLDRGKRLGKTITQYKEMFFRPDGIHGVLHDKYEPLEDAKEKIFERISDITVSMSAEDYLELPEKRHNYIYIPMPESIRKEYKIFEREKVLEIFGEGQLITAANAAALCNKLLQYANGAVYDAEKEWHEVHRLKLDALEELMEAAQGNPVLVAYTYQSDAARIEKRFKKYKPRRMNTAKDEKDWNEGKIPMLIMHPASGGHGLNLQFGGSIIIWFGQTWDLELLLQLNGRLGRQGGLTAPVVINYLTLQGSMDEDVLRSQERKNATQRDLIEAVKYRIEKYNKI